VTDPYSTSGCPCGARCERCGKQFDLVVVARRSAAGVLCLTLCPVDARAGDLPPLKATTAVKLAAEHAAHLAAR
jgi:hypothetical protein